MASLGDFSIRMSKRGKQVTDNTNRNIKRLALAIDQTIVLATPVDTGRARSNWILAVGSATRSQIEPYSAYSRGSKGGGAERGETANAKSAMDQAKVAVSSRQPEQTIFISNNLDYIGILNSPQTPSKQADPFFVQGAIQAAVNEFRRMKVFVDIGYDPEVNK